ncbi:MAG: CHAT domain-containing protein [Deltaproteobacteria bacterium]|nr:CHAT domain-containing protein [Deltaproteobacteria bacterium]
MSDTLVVHVHFGSDFIQIRANGAVEKVPVEAAARTAVITTAQTTIKEYYLSKSSGSFFDQGRLIALGRSLFDFLDTTSVVTRILDDAERKGCKTLVFEYSGADDLRELPWELLAAEAYLAEAVNPLYSPVRLLWADERAHTRNPSPPAPRDLSVLLLAASPEGVEPVLSYEDEETRIERSVAQKRLELVTEESGSLLGLRERLHSRVDGAWDVVHITCHGTLHPKPSLILEDEEGGPDVVDAQRFATDGLAGRVPRLCFVSACHSAESEPTGGLPSLAQVLTRAGVDHVIGWASTVFDTAATDFATRLYEELSSAAPVERAIALARFRSYSESIANLRRLVSRPGLFAAIRRKPAGDGRCRPPAPRRAARS